MKTKLDKQLKQKLDVRHLKDYENGGWGAATSAPYRVKKWLSKELSDRLLAAAYAEWDRAKAAFDAIPASKRTNGWHSLCKELVKWQTYTDGVALPVKVEGHAVHVKFIDCERRRNGRYVAVICARDAGSFYFDMTCNTTGAPRYDRQMNYMVYWDENTRRFYALEWRRASTAPIPENKRRRNWCRKGKQKEFLKECEKLQAKLLEEGIEIASLVEDGGRWHDQVYVDCHDPAEIPDPEAKAEIPEAKAEGGPQAFAKEKKLAPAVPDAGVAVCFTGALSVTRVEAAGMAKAAGMAVQAGVTAATTYLVTNTPGSGSAKNRKAQALGVKVIDEDEFKRLCDALRGPREKAPEVPKQEPKPEPVHALPPLPELPKPAPAWFMSE